MLRRTLLAGIDIGNLNVKIVIGTLDENRSFKVLGTGKVRSTGMRRGVVYDATQVVQNLTSAIEQGEKMVGEPLEGATVSIGGMILRAERMRGVVAVTRQDGVIQSDDLARSIQATQERKQTDNYELIDTSPIYFKVDDCEPVKEPLGMVGIRLEADVLNTYALRSKQELLLKCVHQVGVDIDDKTPVFLATAKSTLSRESMEVGVVLVDIGGSTTTVSIYQEGSLLHATVIPIGANHITQDIAIGIRTTLAVAEKIKLDFGVARARRINIREKISLSSYDASMDQEIPRDYLAKIIEARVQEILEKVQEELTNNVDGILLPAGVYLVGGGALLPELTEFARDILKLPVQIGFANNMTSIAGNSDNPEFAAATGCMMLHALTTKDRFSLKEFGVRSVAGNVTSFFKSFLPK